jgi:hypothetical protein
MIMPVPPQIEEGPAETVLTANRLVVAQQRPRGRKRRLVVLLVLGMLIGWSISITVQATSMTSFWLQIAAVVLVIFAAVDELRRVLAPGDPAHVSDELVYFTSDGSEEPLANYLHLELFVLSRDDIFLPSLRQQCVLVLRHQDDRQLDLEVGMVTGRGAGEHYAQETARRLAKPLEGVYLPA